MHVSCAPPGTRLLTLHLGVMLGEHHMHIAAVQVGMQHFSLYALTACRDDAMRNDATSASISGVDQVGFAAAQPLPPGSAAAWPQADPATMAAHQPESTADIPMELGASNDLLGEVMGLSLDAFAKPPEPTMDLSQQMVQMVQLHQNPGVATGASSQAEMGGRAGAMQRVPSATAITCQVGGAWEPQTLKA
jgi:hypothetical protein